MTGNPAVPGTTGRIPLAAVAAAQARVAPEPGAIVAVSQCVPPMPAAVHGLRPTPVHYLVWTGSAWVGAIWAHRDRELGWRFYDRTGGVLRPTHYQVPPAAPVPAASPCSDTSVSTDGGACGTVVPGTRQLDRVLPSGLAVSAAGTILNNPVSLARVLAASAATLRRQRLTLVAGDELAAAAELEAGTTRCELDHGQTQGVER